MAVRLRKQAESRQKGGARMSNNLARGLLKARRCRATSSDLLYLAFIEETHRCEIADLVLFELNATHC